jgi:hypothetical protein
VFGLRVVDIILVVIGVKLEPPVDICVVGIILVAIGVKFEPPVELELNDPWPKRPDICVDLVGGIVVGITVGTARI